MSYADVEETFRKRLAQEGMSHLLCIEMEIALRNQSAQEFAELHAYHTCERCRRIYTETEYSLLPVARGGLWHKDEWGLAEYRSCNTVLEDRTECGSTLEHVHEVYKRHEPRLRVWGHSQGKTLLCDRCMHRIDGMYVSQVPPRRHQFDRSYHRTLCAECAGGAPK
jgi:hypothetical protein